MKERDKEILSAMVDGRADSREIQRILGQAHDESVQLYWRNLCRQQDLLNQATAQWADTDISLSIAAAIDKQATHQPLAIRDGSPIPSLEGGKIQHKSRLWSSLAVAASIMFMAIFLVEGWLQEGASSNVPVVADAGSDLQMEPQLPSVVGGSPSQAELLASTSDTDYEQKLQSLLMKHAENAAVGPGSSVVPLARLTSFQASQE